MATGLAYWEGIWGKRERQLEKREDLLARPDLLESRVAAHAGVFSTSTRKARAKRGESKMGALERRNEGTPMEGFGTELLNAYTAALEDPKLLKLSDRQLLAVLSENLLRSESAGPGSSRLEKSYINKWRADTGAGNLFGFFGEDKDVRKPPGYEQYLERRKAEPVEEWHTGPGEAAAIGAGFTGALIMGSRVLGRTAMMAPIPGARIAGAALMAIPEFIAFDAIHNVIAKTDWGRAREGTWRKLGADALVGGAVLGGGAIAARAAVKRAAVKLSTSKGMRDMFMKNPTARAAILTSEAKKAADIAQERANQAIIKNVGKEDVLDTFSDFDQVLKNIGAEKRFEQEIARPVPPRMAGPGLMKPATPVIGTAVRPATKANKFIKSILKDQGVVTPLTKAQAARAFARELSEVRADMALKKAARTRDIKGAIAEQRRVQQLAREQSKAATIAEKHAAATAKKRAAQRTKLIKKKKVEKDVVDTLPGVVLTSAEIKAKLIAERGIAPKVKLRKGKVKVTKVKPEATGLTEETRAAMEAIEDETRETIGLAEKSGLEETLYGGGAEEGFVEGVKKGGKDLTDLMKNGEKLLGLGLVGAGTFGSVLLSDLFGAREAEASPLATTLAEAGVKVSRAVAGTMKKVVTEETMIKAAQEWRDAGVLHIPAVGKEKNTFQEVIRLAPWAAKQHGDLIKNIRSNKAPMFAIKHGSPYWSGDMLYKINPEVEVGGVLSAIGNNAGDSLAVTSRIFTDVPGVVKGGAKVTKDVMDTMEPIAKKFSADVPAYRTAVWEEENLGKIFDKLYKALGEEQGVTLKKTDRRTVAELLGMKSIKGRIKGVQHERALEAIEAKMAGWKVAQEELKPSVEAYLAEVDVAHRALAAKHAATRIALAAEDTAEYAKYPWLRSLMSPEEEEAVIYLKKMMENYGVRMAETGHDIIEGPYMHHAWHPAWSEEAAAKKLEGFGLHSRGIPYSKFYRRTQFSRQMVPDINYIMPKYLMDAERRIQWSGFWGVGQKDSWYSHMAWINKFGTEHQKTFWRILKDSSIPPAPTKANTLANIYASFEVARLLSFSGSVPLKHYFKLIGNISTLGFKNFSSTYFKSIATAIRSAKSVPEVLTIARKAGIKIPETTKGKNKLANEVCNSFITQIHRMNTIADLDFEAVIPNKVGFAQALTKKLQGFNRWGSIGIRAIEAVDRHHSVLAGWEMAAKKGMTAKDAYYGIYSNIFRNNFLSNAGNPVWMRNPKIRAVLLFQNTVFKIMERRLWTALRAGKDVKTAIGVIRHQNIAETLRQMGEIGKYVVGAEKELKQNLIFDALTMTKDHYGTPVLKQAMTEAVLSGAILGGAGIVGMNLTPQVWHVPFVAHGAKAPTLAVNPFINAAFRTLGEREEAVEYDVDQDFLITQFLKNWMKSTGYLPQTANKLLKISNNDVPEIYKGSKWKYFFSVLARD